MDSSSSSDYRTRVTQMGNWGGGGRAEPCRRDPLDDVASEWWWISRAGDQLVGPFTPTPAQQLLG